MDPMAKADRKHRFSFLMGPITKGVDLERREEEEWEAEERDKTKEEEEDGVGRGVGGTRI